MESNYAVLLADFSHKIIFHSILYGTSNDYYVHHKWLHHPSVLKMIHYSDILGSFNPLHSGNPLHH